MHIRLSLIIALLISPLVSLCAGQETSGIHTFAKNTPPAPAAIQQALVKLHDAGVIDDLKVWTDYATSGVDVESDKIQALIIAVANKLDHAESFDDAIRILGDKKVFANPGLWKSLASREIVKSDLVALLVVTLAKNFK